MNLLIMGLPGAGKGAQAAKIVGKFDVAHISTGDMSRTAIANKAEMGVLTKLFIDKDELVPDEVTNGIIKERLTQGDIAEKGFLLDSYPRTIEQAHTLDEAPNSLDPRLDGVVNIEVNPESFIERLNGRTINRKTDETFHKVFNSPVGDYNEDDFYQREDDKPETVKRRLDVNITQGAPVIEHYRRAGIVFDVRSNQNIDDVLTDIVKAISSLE